MSRARLLLVAAAVALVVLAAAVAGAYRYYFGAPDRSAAELVPANTIAFATVPNGALLVDAFQSSAARTLWESPNMQPLHDFVVSSLGPKIVELLPSFLPNLSGQSFIAVTHFDPDRPAQIGLIAAMKPRGGMGDFGSFVDKFRATYPELVKNAQIGQGVLDGYRYDSFQPAGAPARVCVAQIKGWIVVAWGDEPLQDWIERFEKRATTSSLADDPNYRELLVRVGDHPMTLAYANYRGILKTAQQEAAKSNPALADMIGRDLDSVGGAAVASRIENGEIVDRYSFLMPRPVQLQTGLGADPCTFDTLKFTSRDTRLYWAGNVNWQQAYQNFKDRQHLSPNAADAPVSRAEDWLRGAGLDMQKNVVDALGPEVSIQSEWAEDATIPDLGVFVKLDKPDDFKLVIGAVVEAARQAYAGSAVVKQISADQQNFATLNFGPGALLSPTITENGPYLGIFLTANQAVRSFQRDPSVTLARNPNFVRQIGDRRNGAQQVVFLDSPYLLDRAYRTALPYLSVAEMFNRGLANAVGGRQLPDDLGWLAPMGTWSCVVTSDENGVQTYSASGVGNQGLLLSLAGGGAMSAAQMMGVLPKSGGLFSGPNSPAPVSGADLPAAPPPPPAMITLPLGAPAIPTPGSVTPPAPSGTGLVSPAPHASPDATSPPPTH